MKLTVLDFRREDDLKFLGTAKLNYETVKSQLGKGGNKYKILESCKMK
jgi:hypothetical protein